MLGGFVDNGVYFLLKEFEGFVASDFGFIEGIVFCC